MSHYVPVESQLPAYHVGPGREFTSFTACVWALRNDRSEKIIYVDGGTYDIFREYRESDIPRPPKVMETVHAFRPYNAILSENTHVIGIGRVILKYEPSAEDTWETESKVVSPLNLAASATVENIEIVCKNCRYCIHDETLGIPEFAGATKRYFHVVCRHLPNDPGLGFKACLGFGFDNNMTFEFEDCEFYAVNGGRAFYMHNRAKSGDRFHPLAPGEVREHIVYPEEESSRIMVRNCVIDSGDKANTCVKLGNCSNYPQHILAQFDHCWFSGVIELRDENSETDGKVRNAYDLRLLYCNEAEVKIPDPQNRFIPRIYRY